MEPTEDDQITASGDLANSMEQLVAEGIQKTIPVPDGANLDLKIFPNCDFYYKLVAKVGGKYYSIYDGGTEYLIGKKMAQ